MSTFAYLRVSTSEQTTENQKREIRNAIKAEPDYIFSEQISGSVPTSQRPIFSEIMGKLRPDDVLVVTKIDRLGRNMIDVAQTVEKLIAMKVKIVCLQLGYNDLLSPTGKLAFQMMLVFAEFERALLIERTNSGLARARAQGKKLGRPRKITEKRVQKILAERGQGLSISAIARANNISRTSVRRFLSED